jgi:cell division protein FtsW (lipid II flippase)
VEIVYFTLVAIGLYAVADAALRWLERLHGARFENRQLVFFAIILPLALLTFWLLQAFGPPAGS